MQLAGTFQSVPGPVVQADVVYPAAALAPALGRPFVGGATAVVNVIPTAAEYGDRLNQLDFRSAKILRLGGLRTALNVDLFNALNANRGVDGESVVCAVPAATERAESTAREVQCATGFLKHEEHGDHEDQ